MAEPASGSRILITGGLGFLGQHVTDALLREFPDVRIRIIDLKPSAAPTFDFSEDPRVSIALGRNICRACSLNGDFKDVDLAIHLAGLVSFSLSDLRRLYQVNVKGTRNVLRAALLQRVPRVIHISSVAALGFSDDRQRPVDESFDFDWRIARARRKYYMLSKHAADLLVKHYRVRGLNVTTLYPGLMFGPGDVLNSLKWIKAIHSRRMLFNMPGGTNIVDVRDVARGIVAAVRTNLEATDVLLSGHNLTFHETNTYFARALGVSPPVLTLPRGLREMLRRLLLLLEYRSGHSLALTADNVDSAFLHRYFDNTRARQLLGWSPSIAFSQTVQDTIHWMKRNGYLEG